ncbi:MAG: hypothetical protein M3P06_17075 [Acidobacteriota bacterium]|nr:hypothetical protein [Acidobacteriota bacterium]
MSSSGAAVLPYLLLGFLVYLYLPHIFFKLGAEGWLDLGRKKDSSQLEEFLSAALPSAGLNLVACSLIFFPRAVLRVVTLIIQWIAGMLSADFWQGYAAYSSWTPGSVDWPTLSRLLGEAGQNTGLAAYVGRGNWWGEMAYLVWLYAIAVFNGRSYGRIVNARARRGATKAHLAKEIWSKLTPREQFRWLVGGFFFKLWDPFYHEFHVSMFTWMARSDYMWVRTADDRLFFGSFFRYEKTNMGEVAGIVLTNVHRYKHDAPVPEIDPFEGQLFVPASRIADINLTSADSFKKLRARLARKDRERATHSAHALPASSQETTEDS